MSRLFTGYIDVTKINRDKLTEGKAGQQYLNIALWLNEEPDQFGNAGSIQETLTKEERDAGKSKNYLGNFKEFIKNNNPKGEQKAKGSKEDLPF